MLERFTAYRTANPTSYIINPTFHHDLFHATPPVYRASCRSVFCRLSGGAVGVCLAGGAGIRKQPEPIDVDRNRSGRQSSGQRSRAPIGRREFISGVRCRSAHARKIRGCASRWFCQTAKWCKKRATFRSARKTSAIGPKLPKPWPEDGGKTRALATPEKKKSCSSPFRFAREEKSSALFGQANRRQKSSRFTATVLALC